MATPESQSSQSHRWVYGAVYMNDLARDAAIQHRTIFPVGAIIVREKLSAVDAPQAEVLAVMIKHEHGFNPAASDWEFLKIDGPATTIATREKTGSCQQCHATEKRDDFVFRNYFPPPKS